MELKEGPLLRILRGEQAHKGDLSDILVVDLKALKSQNQDSEVGPETNWKQV